MRVRTLTVPVAQSVHDGTGVIILSDNQHVDFGSACPCGSGKTYGECCGKGEACSCGSGKPHAECCGKK